MRTIDEVNAELEQVRDQLARRKKLLSVRDNLLEQRRERQRTEEETAQALYREESDVEELEHMSFKALLAALKGDREEQLSRERREALSARLRHDQAVRDLEDIQRRIEALEEELRPLVDCSARLRELMEEKAAVLRAQGGAEGERLADLEEELAQVRARRKELGEALYAGRQVLSAAGRMESSLDSAASMGTWDMLGGGLFATAAKHQHLDEARYAADEVQGALRSFRTELADVSMKIESPTVEVGQFATFADYFFDGLFADWAVQNRIHDAQWSVSSVRSKVEQVMNRLRYMDEEEERRSVALERERGEILNQAQ